MRKILMCTIMTVIGNSAVAMQFSLQFPVDLGKHAPRRQATSSMNVNKAHSSDRQNRTAGADLCAETPHAYLRAIVQQATTQDSADSNKSVKSNGSASPVTVKAGSPEGNGISLDINKLSDEQVIQNSLATSPKISGIAIALKLQRLQQLTKAAQ